MSQETFELVDREHEEHARQVQALTEALHAHPVDLLELRRVVSEIDHELPGHLRREETVVLPWLGRVLPDAADELHRLTHEHVELFAAVTSLRYALASPAAATGTVATAGLRFLAFFREHLEREEALIERAVASGQVPDRSSGSPVDAGPVPV